MTRRQIWWLLGAGVVLGILLAWVAAARRRRVGPEGFQTAISVTDTLRTAFETLVATQDTPTIRQLIEQVMNSTAGKCVYGEVITGKDAPGGDLLNQRLPDGSDFTACQTLCCNTGECRGYVFTPSSPVNSNTCVIGKPCCFMKRNLPPQINYTGEIYIGTVTPPTSETAPVTARDVYTTTFPKQLAILALANTGRDPVRARADLIANYTAYQTALPQLNRNSATVMDAWRADPKAQTCAQLADLRTQFAARLAQYKSRLTGLQDTVTTAVAMRDENMAYQNQFKADCEKNLTPACINLASQDSQLFPLLATYDGVVATQADTEITLTESLKVVSDVATLLKCPGGGPAFNVDTDMSYIDVETLRTRLEQMSPYYIAPATLEYITSKVLISEDQQSVLASSKENLAKLDTTIATIQELSKTTGV